MGEQRSRVERADEILAAATTLSAARLEEVSQGGESLSEIRHQQPVVRAALSEVQLGKVYEAEQTFDLPNWKPRPGGVDVIVRDGNGSPWIAAELKLGRVDWMLWDTLKMIDLLNLDRFEAAYIILGTTVPGWSSTYRVCPRNGKTTALFTPGDTVHDTAELFTKNAHAWYDLLTGGRGRPLRVPAAIRTVLVQEAPLTFDGKAGSMRTMRVESASDQWLEFSNNWHAGEWPLGVEPCDHYREWRQRTYEVVD